MNPLFTICDFFKRACGPPALVLFVAPLANAQGPGAVLTHQKISATQGGFTGPIGNDHFGWSMASLGDLDGDGVRDLAVGAPWDSDGGLDRGAVWILFLNPDGTVRSHQKISDFFGGLGSPLNSVLEDGDEFGNAVAPIGDLDGDGIVDLAVGAWHDRGGGAVFDQRGAVWILFLRANGTVRAKQKISDADGGFTGTLESTDFFGRSLAALGDHDGDTIPDLAVGSLQDDDGGTDHGAVWILFLNADGTVKGHQKISDSEGGFTGTLDDQDELGSAVASLGDLDGDGVGDLAAGSWRDAASGGIGSVWILFLNMDGTVRAHTRISSEDGGMQGEALFFFGGSLAYLGDHDGDGIGDLAAGSAGDDDGGSNRGAAWVLFLNTDGTVRASQKISDLEGGFTGDLDDEDTFGSPLAFLGDQNGDGIGDLAVGATQDDDGGTDFGAVWLLFLDGLVHAGSTPRNGAGTNTACLTDQTLPVLGATWDTEVSHAHHPGATMTLLYAFAGAGSGLTIAAGEVLVDVTSMRLFRDTVVSSGTFDARSIAVPLDVSLAGLTASTQALILGGGAELCNALDVRLGF